MNDSRVSSYDSSAHLFFDESFRTASSSPARILQREVQKALEGGSIKIIAVGKPLANPYLVASHFRRIATSRVYKRMPDRRKVTDMSLNGLHPRGWILCSVYLNFFGVRSTPYIEMSWVNANCDGIWF